MWFSSFFSFSTRQSKGHAINQSIADEILENEWEIVLTETMLHVEDIVTTDALPVPMEPCLTEPEHGLDLEVNIQELPSEEPPQETHEFHYQEEEAEEEFPEFWRYNQPCQYRRHNGQKNRKARKGGKHHRCICHF